MNIVSFYERQNIVLFEIEVGDFLVVIVPQNDVLSCLVCDRWELLLLASSCKPPASARAFLTGGLGYILVELAHSYPSQNVST